MEINKYRIGSAAVLLCLFAVFAAISYGQTVVRQGAGPEKVVSGFQFTEGPLWHPKGFLLFSDIPANTIFKWVPGGDSAEVYLKPSGHSNGLAMNADTGLVLAQHDGRISLVSSRKDSQVLVSEFEGKRLNSPNDLVVHSDGTIYFTDPPFGVSEENKELAFSGVYKWSAEGVLSLLYSELDRPNGIALSPDEKTLYVNNSTDGRILAFDVTSDGNVSLPDEFANVGKASDSGAADGMTVDTAGRVYSTGPGGIYIFDSEGRQVQKIDLPVRATNMGWGGPDNKTLYITTPNSIYRLEMSATGIN